MMLNTGWIALLFTLLTLSPPALLANETKNRAILLNSLIGEQPQTVKLLIVSGPAKGCQADGIAKLNPKRKRYEFKLEPIACVKDGQTIQVGTVVRGQHYILGTMANSGMGRTFLVSNKGVTVTLADK